LKKHRLHAFDNAKTMIKSLAQKHYKKFLETFILEFLKCL